MPLHIDDVKTMAKDAHRNAEVLEEFFADALRGEGDVAYGAAWALTHLPSEDNVHIAAHRDDLVRFALSTGNTSLRRLTLTLLLRLEWGEDDVRADLLDFALQHLLDPDEADGVRSVCVKLAWMQARHYKELCGELKQTLLLLDPTELKPSVKCVRSKILKQL